MTTQTVNNTEKLATIKNAQDALVYDLITQALRAAKTAGAYVGVWNDNSDGENELRVTVRGARRQYMTFTDKDKSDIGALIDAVEWLLNGAPKEKDEEEEEDE